MGILGIEGVFGCECGWVGFFFWTHVLMRESNGIGMSNSSLIMSDFSDINHGRS